MERKETSSFPPLCWAGKDGLQPADSCFLVDEGGMGAWVDGRVAAVGVVLVVREWAFFSACDCWYSFMRTTHLKE